MEKEKKARQKFGGQLGLRWDGKRHTEISNEKQN
jgi:hypothetical protein